MYIVVFIRTFQPSFHLFKSGNSENAFLLLIYIIRRRYPPDVKSLASLVSALVMNPDSSFINLN